MTSNPVLSICMPSRNRQTYFQTMIAALLESRRGDVEFVFADNSDDPSVMDGVMAGIDDPRVVYLPSTGRTLSMLENWERTIAVSRGEWVTFIGDDDFIDVNLADMLTRLMQTAPEVEAFSWTMGRYVWREGEDDSDVTTVDVSLNADLIRMQRSELMRRMFGWADATLIPTSGFSIYHAAVRRSLLERIRSTYGGTYFENPNVDYDMALKVIYEGRHFIHCLRPFSIMGSCRMSNSYSIGRLEDTRRKIALFIEEVGRNFEDDPALKDFPFHSLLGVTASIACTIYWFKARYNIHYAGWERGFVEACARNTETYVEEADFEAIRAGYEAALRVWQNGRFLKFFKPVRRPRPQKTVVSGFSESLVYLRSDIAGATNPAEIWRVIAAMIRPVAQIEQRITSLAILDQDRSGAQKSTHPAALPTYARASAGKLSRRRK